MRAKRRPTAEYPETPYPTDLCCPVAIVDSAHNRRDLARVRRLRPRVAEWPLVVRDRAAMVRRLPELRGRFVGGWGPDRGLVSDREFDRARAGGELRALRLGRIRITPKGVARARSHLDRFQAGRAELMMLDRLEAVAEGGATPEVEDVRFYAHELREAVRYRRLGVPEGQRQRPGESDDEGYALWNNAHTATLEEYGISDDRDLYHASARRYLPD